LHEKQESESPDSEQEESGKDLTFEQDTSPTKAASKQERDLSEEKKELSAHQDRQLEMVMRLEK